MERLGRVAAVVVLAVLAASDVRVRAQSAADFAQTAAYAAAHQNADGGLAAGPGQPSTLGVTSAGLRVLDYVRGSLLDEPGCIRFVNSCKVPGGFAQRPGGKPDVVTTAIGLMAAAELKITDKAMIDDAIAYFGAHAKAFEEVRMAIAGLEAVSARSPDFARWADQLEAMRSPDGSFGQHPGKAFVTGGVAAAILRMGMNLKKRDAVIATIKAGQRPDGAWSNDDGPSDLSSSYRAMRALYLLKEKPDVERLTGYITRCRHADGNYSNTLGGNPAGAAVGRPGRLHPDRTQGNEDRSPGLAPVHRGVAPPGAQRSLLGIHRGVPQGGLRRRPARGHSGAQHRADQRQD